MLDQEVVEAFNARPRVNLNNLRTLSVSQRDQVKQYGSEAEALLRNRQLALFVHHWKFDITDQLAEIQGHTEDDNRRRIALSLQLQGIESFIQSLKRAVALKNRAVSLDGPVNEG